MAVLYMLLGAPQADGPGGTLASLGDAWETASA
jgi:hypothetical protein